MVILPWLFWLSFEKPNRAPFVMYSCVDNSFMIRGTENGEKYFMNEHGEKYEMEEFEQKLPLLNLRQLMISNTLPDTINAVEMDPHVINAARSFYRYKPAAKNAPKPGLYPMFESESGRASLTMPTDFFQIKSRMEFIDAASNKVNEQKTALFTGALQHYGFSFPAKMIEGIPTTRKSCDEGYFIVDNADQVFHIKMEQGEPYVKKVEIPKGLSFKYIACVDFRNKAYYCYLIGHDNSIFVITQDDYDLERLPVEGFNPENQELRIYGDLFNYNVIMLGKSHMKVVALDADFNKVAEYNKTWLKRADTPQGKAFSFLFPAQLNMYDKYSSFVNFYFHPTKTINWIYLNILLVIGQFIIIRRRKINPINHIADFAIVLVTGIFGFLAINIFPNKQ